MKFTLRVVFFMFEAKGSIHNSVYFLFNFDSVSVCIKDTSDAHAYFCDVSAVVLPVDMPIKYGAKCRDGKWAAATECGKRTFGHYAHLCFLSSPVAC